MRGVAIPKEQAREIILDEITGEEVTPNIYEAALIKTVQEINRLHKELDVNNEPPRIYMWTYKRGELLISYYNQRNTLKEKDGKRIVQLEGTILHLKLYLNAYAAALKAVKVGFIEQ